MTVGELKAQFKNGIKRDDENPRLVSDPSFYIAIKNGILGLGCKVNLSHSPEPETIQENVEFETWEIINEFASREECDIVKKNASQIDNKPRN